MICAARSATIVAAVYVEVPSYLGVIEPHAAEIARLRMPRARCWSSVSMRSRSGCWPRRPTMARISSSAKRRRLACTCIYSGGLCGFIASRDEPAFVAEYPYLMVCIAPGRTEGEMGIRLVDDGADLLRPARKLARLYRHHAMAVGHHRGGLSLAARTARIERSRRRDPAAVALCDAAAERDPRASRRRCSMRRTSRSSSSISMARARRVAEINTALRERGIFGGHDLCAEFPELGQSALYCVTEIHTQSRYRPARRGDRGGLA